MERNFNAIIEQVDDGFIAEVVELPGCYTQAKTKDELLKRIAEAIKLYLSTGPGNDGRREVFKLAVEA